MRSIGSYLLLIGVVALFLLHVGMVLMAKLGGAVPDELFMKQMIFAFVLIICIFLIFKRSIIGGILYVITNVTYYILISALSIDSLKALSTDTLVALMSVLFSVLVLLEILYTKVRQRVGGTDKKTDWYYKDETYDRVMDERADRNNYKF